MWRLVAVRPSAAADEARRDSDMMDGVELLFVKGYPPMQAGKSATLTARTLPGFMALAPEDKIAFTRSVGRARRAIH
jgi:hypothetical protein